MRCPTLKEIVPPPPAKVQWPWTEESSRLPETILNGSGWPCISIVTPSYNQGQFLEETIRSVLLQNYPNLELIIIDGGSTDSSIEIIKRYEPWLTYWVSEPDRGQTYAIQKGMCQTKGEIVNWLNADDFLLPEALFNIAKAWLSHEKSSVFCGDAIIVNSDSVLLSSQKAHWANEASKLLPSSPPVHGGIQASWFLTKDLWDKVSGLNVNLEYTMDTDLYYRCLEEGGGFVLVNQNVAAYRTHSDTKTRKGWQKSVDYKRRFYYSKCNQLSDRDRHIYLPRIRRFLCTQYLNSISPLDTITVRAMKLARSIRESPEYFSVPYQIKRAFKKLFNL